MTLAHTLLIAWDWEPSVLAGCAGLLAGYVALVRSLASPAPPDDRTELPSGYPRSGCSGEGVERTEGVQSSRTIVFVTGVLVLLLALVSPIDVLGDSYLFSAHMAQHLLLVLVVPPLLLLGVPPLAYERLLAWTPAIACERVLGHPALAWFAGVLTLWVWHVPALYNAALAHEGIHIVQHATFLITATIFWWPVVAPEPYRLEPWSAVVYLVLGGFANSVLAIIITYGPVGLYPAYEHPVDVLGIEPLVRYGWGLSPKADQQLGGMLMWIPGGWVYLLAMIIKVVQWYDGASDVADVRAGIAAASSGRIQEGR